MWILIYHWSSVICRWFPLSSTFTLRLIQRTKYRTSSSHATIRMSGDVTTTTRHATPAIRTGLLLAREQICGEFETWMQQCANTRIMCVYIRSAFLHAHIFDLIYQFCAVWDEPIFRYAYYSNCSIQKNKNA